MMTQSAASGDGPGGCEGAGTDSDTWAPFVSTGASPCPSQGRGWGGTGFMASGLTCCLRVVRLQDQERTAHMMLGCFSLCRFPGSRLSPSERLGRRKEFDTHEGEEESRASLS